MRRKATSKRSTRGRPSGAPPVTSYAQALDYLDAHTNLERLRRIKPGPDSFRLDRMLELCAALGHPERQFPVIHVAGTKGKGSTVAMLASALQGAGLTTGTYTSPHLLDVRERITVGGQMIRKRDLMYGIREVARAAQRIRDSRLHYFEILTAAAFVHFAREAVDAAVIEVGLGGRLDATNVVVPALSVITPISYDHMDLLGDTLTLIAREKAGIFKKGVPAVSAPQTAEAERSLRDEAQRIGCTLAVVGREYSWAESQETEPGDGQATMREVSVAIQGRVHGPVQAPLPGAHQAANCATAIAALDALRLTGMRFSMARALGGLAQTEIAGRFQVIPAGRLEGVAMPVVVDGAHNAASLECLLRTLAERFPDRRKVVIFGCAADKDVKRMMPLLAERADEVVFTRAATTRRGLAPSDLAESWRGVTQRACGTAPNLRAAFGKARRLAGGESVVCVTGSFYLVGEALELAGVRSSS